MKKNIIFLFVAAALMNLNGFSQGFVNLGFEKAVINISGAPQFQTYASNAIPGWTAYISGAAQTTLAYNAISLGSAAISIHDTNDVYPKIQGVYFILLQSASQAFPLGPQSAGIGQTGQIPVWAMTMSFWGYFGGSLSFNNQSLSYLQTGSAANYNIWTVDISAFAGQTGELLFTVPFPNPYFGYGNSARIDNIQFSSTAVPEPGTLALVALGASLFGLRRKRNSREF